MFMLLTDKYADKIYGTITCYNYMIIQGYIPEWSHTEGIDRLPERQQHPYF